MPLPRLLVFDLDGTLIDSSLDLCNAVNAALAHVGHAALPNARIAAYIGDGAATLVHRALYGTTGPGAPPSPVSSAKVGPPQDPLFKRTFSFFLAFYHEHKLDNTRPYPGVLEALQTIRTRHPYLPMAVLTNKPYRPSRAICEALGLAPFFFQNYGGDSFPTKKPDPTGLLTLIAEANIYLERHVISTDQRERRDPRIESGDADHAGPLLTDQAREDTPITPADTIMIGDSDVDILTARNCGARSLACTYGLAPQTLTAANPDMTVGHPSEWPTALRL